MINFELNDVQRKYFGLNPINNSWDKVLFSKGLICYFDHDLICKVLLSVSGEDEQYIEFDTEIPTNKRLKIIAKTGKEQAITWSTLQNKTRTVQLDFKRLTYQGKESYKQIVWEIGKHKLDLKNNVPDFEQVTDLDKFKHYVDSFIAGVPENHLKRIEALKAKDLPKLKPVKFKAGDFFAVPVKYDLYGDPVIYTFGRVLIDIAALRKQGLVNREHHLYDLMTKVQLITLYDYHSTTLIKDPEYLKQQKAIPAAYMMDDNLMRGIYPIIGHLPVMAEELDFPMHYGKYISSTRPGYYFGWGMIMTVDLPEIPFKDYDMVHDYRNNGVGFGAPTDILELLRKGLPPYYENTTIEHPENVDLKTAIFKSMGVEPGIDYDDLCRKKNVPDRTVLLTMLK